MSGVQSGSHLERLEALRARIDMEIAVERRRAILAGEIKPGFITFNRPTLPSPSTQTRLQQLGVTPRQVKVWAVGAGLLPAVQRGRVALTIVEAYAKAHPR